MGVIFSVGIMACGSEEIIEFNSNSNSKADNPIQSQTTQDYCFKSAHGITDELELKLGGARLQIPNFPTMESPMGIQNLCLNEHRTNMYYTISSPDISSSAFPVEVLAEEIRLISFSANGCNNVPTTITKETYQNEESLLFTYSKIPKSSERPLYKSNPNAMEEKEFIYDGIEYKVSVPKRVRVGTAKSAEDGRIEITDICTSPQYDSICTFGLNEQGMLYFKWK
jgi:hypothetical protein